MKIYIKFYNRSLPLYAVQYWYKGGRFEIEKLIGAPNTPLFYYENGKATSVYFEKDEYDEADRKLADYFMQNPNELEKGIEKYKNLYKDGLIAIDKKDPAALFDIAVGMWPILNAVMVLGEMDFKDSVMNRLKEIAIKTRSQTDRFIYEIGNGIWNSIGDFVPDEQKSFLTIDEIINEQCPSLSDMASRKKSYIYTEDKLVTGISLIDFMKDHSYELEEGQLLDDIKEFSGDVACKGKVTGKVRIVMEFRHMFEFQEGEILVSSMTVPDFLPVMKKAAAFVTDEGGITCHAAIIAREMGKPCIIGTKIATQVLKNGDLIEVDANKGKIKIL